MGEKEAAEFRAVEEYFGLGAARTALLTAGVPPVKIYSVERRSKPSFFGYKEIENATPFLHEYGSTRTEVRVRVGFSVSSHGNTASSNLLVMEFMRKSRGNV